MEITGARTCLQLSLSCSLRATRNPPMTCKLWLGWISAGWWEACWPHGGNSGETHRALNLFGAHFQTARFFEFFTGGM
jgi:hypothetical protein